MAIRLDQVPIKELLENGDYAIVLALEAGALDLRRVPTNGLPGGGALPSTPANQVLAGPASGSSAALAEPRALVLADLPAIGISDLSDGSQVLTGSGTQDIDGPKTFVSGVLVLKNLDNSRLTVLLSQDANANITFPASSGTLALLTDLDSRQPLDSDLTAIAALATTSYGRSLLELADAAAARTALALGTAATASASAFAAASHTHAAADIASGTIATGRLGSGTANSTTFLRGDQTWTTVTVPTAADPTGTIGLTASNGTAANYMRSDAAPALSQSISPTWTASHTWSQALAANTAGTGILLTNTTAATSGNQRYSPALRLTGQGWKTNTTAASQAVDYRVYAVPVQGAASPTANFVIDFAVNGGAFSNVFSMTSAGVITLPSGGSSGLAWTNSSFYCTQDETYVWARGNGGTIRMSLNANTLGMTTSGVFGFGTVSATAATLDVAIGRNAAGLLEVNSGTAGTLRDIVVRKYLVGSSSGPTWSSGTGSPEGVVTAPIGSLYSRTDGGAATTLYVKESGAGNTGWVAK